MERKKRLPAVQRKQDLRCAICEEEKPLTDDHVFPRVAVEGLKVRISSLYPGPADGGDSIVSQSGVRFKTLCSSCNSRLGNKYDPHLGGLVKQIRAWGKSSISVLDRTKVTADFEAIALSIFGHILAGSSIHPEMVPDVKMRESLLEGKVRRDAPKIFYWWARYSYPTIVRGIVRARVGRVHGDKSPVMSVFKCPPIGFIATDVDEYEGLPSLATATKEGALRIWPGLVKPADWPEAPDEDGFIATGATAIDARIARPVR